MPLFVFRCCLILAFFLSQSHATETKGAAAPKVWSKLTGCRYVPQDYNDGDSFHVKYGNKEFLFRLLFVDTPETDNDYPDRVREQAAYFGLTTEEALKVGKAAKEFTAAILKQPFTVSTQWRNAMGRSNLQRYYAIVEIGNQNLAELLVSRGYARVKGTVANLPNGMKSKDFTEKLKKLEDQAKEKHLGAWAKSAKARSAK